MSRTFRRTTNAAVHHKQHEVVDILEKRHTPDRRIRNRPLGDFKSGELAPVLEAKFHSDNYPNFGKHSGTRRRTTRTLRHKNKLFTHRCVGDNTFADVSIYPKIKKK